MYAFKRGQTSVILRVKLLDSSVSTGAGKTGLSSSSSGLIISTIADNESTATAYTQAGSTIETITTLGTFAAPTATKCRFKEVDATNHPGVYEIQLADARFAVANAKSLLVSISGVANVAQCDLLVRLTDEDPYDSVRGGLTALPNAAAEAAGGLFTRGTGSGQINQDANGRIDVKVATIANDAITAAAIAADAIGSSELAASAVTEIQTGLSTLDAAGVRSAVGLGSANLDTQLATIAGYIDTEVAAILAAVDTEVAAIKAKTDNLPSTNAVQAIWDALTSALTTSGSIGKLLTDNINATISSRLASASYTAPLDAAGVRTALGMGAADLDSQLDVIASYIDTEITALPDAVLDEVVEGTTTVRELLRLFGSVLLGKVSGMAGTSVAFRDLADTKDRVSATVDADGNRTAVTLDPS